MIKEIVLGFLIQKITCEDRVSLCYLKTISQNIKKEVLKSGKPFQGLKDETKRSGFIKKEEGSF